MIKKTILSRQALQDFYGPKVLLYTSNFRFTDAISADTSSFSEIIRGENRTTDVGNAYVQDAGLAMWESRELASMGRSRRYLMVPKKIFQTIEVDSLKDVASRVLEKHMPGRYFYSEPSQGFFLYYPEINITNSLNIKHKIIDLVVFLPITAENFNERIKGVRFAYTPAELNTGYAHSHMNGNQGLTDFCRGGGSPFDNLIMSMQEGFTDGKFELFLFQLQSYLEWESVEGKPYKYLIAINEKTSYSPTYNPPANVVGSYIEAAIRHLDPDLITLAYGVPFFDPGILPEVYLEMEKKIVDEMASTLSESQFQHSFVDYDLETRTYVKPASAFTLPERITTGFSDIKAAFNIRPRVLEGEPRTASNNIIKRPVPVLLDYSITQLSSILQQYNKINE